MTKNIGLSFHRVFNIILSISFLAAGVCLIGGCLSIYYSGTHPYSREAVAETFSKIAIPVYTCLILTVISFIWEFIKPLESKKAPHRKDTKHLIISLSAKKDFSKCEKELITSINKERKIRKIHSLVRTILLCITSIVFLSYALNSNNFHQSEINASMIKAMWILIPCLAIPFVYAIFTVYYNERSLNREFEMVKKVPAAESAMEKSTQVSASEKKINVIRLVIILIAVSVLIYGFIAGGTADVLTKAINICTECIGLG